MARYKDYSYDQGTMIPLNLRDQLIPGTFEFALNHIVDNELDLSVFDERYRNDQLGAPAYHPAILLKIILYAYSRGITRSRDIARCCEENVIFMALSADTRPHFTTIADFVATIRDQIVPLFRNVLLICSADGLIGKEMFAVDGCKISSNCSKEWSGTREDFEKRKAKLEKQIRFLLGKHKMTDERDLASKMVVKEKEAIRRLRSKVKKMKDWLKDNDDKPGKKGKPIQSNITDNESAKMASSHGVIQGYNGQAMVDSQNQIVVHAEAHGQGQEADLLMPMIEGTRENFKEIGDTNNVFENTQLTADAGYHTEKNMEELYTQEIDAVVADKRHRERDPRFDKVQRHKKRPLNNIGRVRGKKYFTPSDFTFDSESRTATCPAGNPMYFADENFKDNKGRTGIRFKAWPSKCRDCSLRPKCMRSPTGQARTVVFYDEESIQAKQRYARSMIEKFDSTVGRYIYSRRIGTVEPVFANITSTLGLNRFSLRGKAKVDSQWKLFCTVHNLMKLWRLAPRFAV